MKRGLAAFKQTAADWLAAPCAVPLVCLAVTLVLAWPFLQTGWRTDAIRYDWDTMFSGAEISRRFWLNHAPYFSWIPWLCGGLTSMEYVFHKVVSPETFVELVAGVVPGGKISYVLWQAFGAWGAARVIRRLVPGASPTVAIAGGLAFGLQGFFLNHLRVGHFGFEFIGGFPWLIEGFLRRSVVQTAFFLGFPVISLAVDYAAHLAIYSILMGLILLAANWREIWYLAKSAAVVVGMSAVVLATHGSKISGFVVEHKEYAQTPASLYRLLTAWQTNLWLCDVDCYWEYGNYLGHALVGLGVAGLVLTAVRGWRTVENRLWVLVGLLAFLFSLGPFAAWGPWTLITKIPVVQNLQVNTRFLSELALFLILGWAVVVARLRQPALQLLIVVATLGPIAAFARTSYALPAHGAVLPDLRGQERDEPEGLDVGDARNASYDAIGARRANTSCYIGVSVTPSPGLRPGQPLLLRGPAGSRLGWDRYEWLLNAGETAPASGSEPALREWVLNQNFNSHFQARLEDPAATGAVAFEAFDAGGNLGLRARGAMPAAARIRLAVQPSLAEHRGLLLSLGTWLMFAGWIGAGWARRVTA